MFWVTYKPYKKASIPLNQNILTLQGFKTKLFNEKMKTMLKELYKKINQNHPIIGNLIRKNNYREVNQVRQKIQGNNNKINYKNAKLSSVMFDIKGDGNQIDINDGCILNNVTFSIQGNNHKICIGSKCLFINGGTIWMEDSDCSLIIGEGSIFRGVVNFMLAEPGSQIKIGQDCLFAHTIEIFTSDFHSIISQESNKRINYAKDVSVGDHVWIGSRVILAKGSVIPENSVVAQGSVVTRRYKTKGIIIGGNPSNQLMAGITWSHNR